MGVALAVVILNKRDVSARVAMLARCGITRIEPRSPVIAELTECAEKMPLPTADFNNVFLVQLVALDEMGG